MPGPLEAQTFGDSSRCPATGTPTQPREQTRTSSQAHTEDGTVKTTTRMQSSLLSYSKPLEHLHAHHDLDNSTLLPQQHSTEESETLTACLTSSSSSTDCGKTKTYRRLRSSRTPAAIKAEAAVDNAMLGTWRGVTCGKVGVS